LERNKVERVFVGAEPDAFELGNRPVATDCQTKRVLFYGQFIPLHGIEYIVRAAKRTEGQDLAWTLVGKGQEAEKIRSLVDELKPNNLDWKEWVDFSELVDLMARSHVVLGIFGLTEKAGRVIPNKVFQALMASRPLVTADTPAIHELLENSAWVRLVPAGDAEALAAGVLDLANSLPEGRPDYPQSMPEIWPNVIGERLMQVLSKLVRSKCSR
jgi:glycosyltransferase involved in cell wall biosynthesis